MILIRRLFVLYILLLSLWPCSDGPTAVADLQGTASISSRVDYHPSNFSGDVCSPFCVCACCQVQVHQESDFQIAIYPSQPVASHFFFAVEAASLLPLAIWQPPRLA